MNDNVYIEERIEDICRERSSEKADVAIEDLLGRNLILQEEVIKLRREQEIQLIRICEVMEQKNEAENDKNMAKETKDYSIKG